MEPIQLKFVEEAEELLGTLSESLLALERVGGGGEPIHTAFRGPPSFKGRAPRPPAAPPAPRRARRGGARPAAGGAAPAAAPGGEGDRWFEDEVPGLDA